MDWQKEAKRLVEHLRAQGITDPRVLRAMERVPRHLFVPPELREMAYWDQPLPIGKGQTISQPFMVAYMSQLLGVEPGQKILEVGTGSGYQAAILAEMGAKVFSVERIEELARRAGEVLARLGYDVKIRVGDGSLGWPEEAPFEGIVVTAGARQAPPALLEQLAEGGRLVIPIGTPWLQHIYLYEKTGGRITETRLIGCNFVPLVGDYSY